MRRKRKPSRKRRGLPPREADSRGSTPPPLPPSGAQSLLTDPALIAGVASFALALLGFYMVGQTGSDLWFLLALPVFVLLYLSKREAARDNRRAVAGWWRRLRSGR